MHSKIFTLSLLLILPLYTCQDDYAYAEEKLLHARKFNQTCEHEGQCSDHRLSCNVEEYTKEKRCLCVKYHSYDVYSQQCLVADNMTDMLSQLIEQYDAQAEWSRGWSTERGGDDPILAEEADEAQRIFTGMLIAGFMVLGVGILMAGVCTVIACYRPKSKDDIKYENVDRRQSALRDRPSTSGNGRNQRAVSPRRDGTVDYVPGMFDLSVI